MQRWFFLEDFKHPKRRVAPKLLKPKEQEMAELLEQSWVFTVNVPETKPKEFVFITGNIPELGEWDFNKIVHLEKREGTDLWSKTLTIPNTCDILYRYGLGIVNNDTNDLIIRQWETFVKPRILRDSDLHPQIDEYGKFNEGKAVTTGWLTSHTLLQFKFLNNPLKLRNCLAGRQMNIKVTPVKLSFGNEPQLDETSLSGDIADEDIACTCLVEVSTLDNNPTLCLLKPQEQFGREYKPDDMLIVNMTVPDHKALAYLVDFYSFSNHASIENAPCHVGYTYVLPNMFKPSEGILQLPVTCNVKHRPLGTIDIEYLVVLPMKENINSLEVSYAKYWSQTWTGLEVGHRGLGASFKTRGHTIRENTITSLKKAATSGADLLEFDVQLSKDMVPVIYHDFHVCISLKRKKEIDRLEMLELPVKDLTLEQLHKLKVYHLVEGRTHEPMVFDEDTDEHQPFPTLQAALESIQEDVGFNVELKWTMEMKDGTFELNNPFDMNIYVDKILEVVLKYAGERRIVFSCFNPDICTMVRNKQNKYPVMFLTVGISDRYEPYRDPRCSSIPAAVQCAVSADILGIVVHTEDLLRDPTQVNVATDAGLVIFCWGDDNNDKDTIRKLKDLGLHAVIYDRLDQYTTKEVKESIFLVEARESQRELMKMAALGEFPASYSTSEQNGSVRRSNKPTTFLDLAYVRNTIGDRSTATSLESLASSMDLRDEFAELKRNQQVIAAVGKESQVKEQLNMFKDVFPECSSKRQRNH